MNFNTSHLSSCDEWYEKAASNKSCGNRSTVQLASEVLLSKAVGKSWIFVRSYFVLPLVLALASLPVLAQSGTLHIVIRDADTHYAVHAQVSLEGPESASFAADDTGNIQASLPAGQYRVEITANGYKPMRTRTAVQSGTTSSIGIMLDPVTPPQEEQSLQSSLEPGLTILHGYAVNDEGQPVQGVSVRLLHSGTHTITNDRGYYEISVSTPPETARDIPGTDTLIAQKQGYKTVIHRNIVIAGEDGGGIFLDMEKGKGVTEFDDTHIQMKGEGALEEQPSAAAPTRSPNAPSPELYQLARQKGGGAADGSGRNHNFSFECDSSVLDYRWSELHESKKA